LIAAYPSKVPWDGKVRVVVVRQLVVVGSVVGVQGVATFNMVEASSRPFCHPSMITLHHHHHHRHHHHHYKIYIGGGGDGGGGGRK